MTLAQSIISKVNVEEYDCARCACTHDHFSDAWHRIYLDKGFCSCVCETCWRVMTIPERLDCYAKLGHHQPKWSELAAAIWAGK